MKIYIGFTQDGKTANIVYDSYNSYSIAQVDNFVEYIKEHYKEVFDIDEEYTVSETKRIILDFAEDYINYDTDSCICDEFGEVVDVYAYENSDDYNADEAVEFIFADGSSVYNCDNTAYLKEVEEHIDEIIAVISENVKII